VLIDPNAVEEIRRLERAMGRDDLLADFVRKLELSLGGFAADFSARVARGDGVGAMRAAHTLKGTCRQLGAAALGDLFAEIEADAKAGDYAGAARKYDEAAGLVAQSIEALKRA
jgi:HPt (histidine-containing phosphotransfer) domain-containing protein